MAMSSSATAVTTSVPNGQMAIPGGVAPLPSGMMIPMMALPPHMQMGMGAPVGLLRAPHMPGKNHLNRVAKCRAFMISFFQACPEDFLPTAPRWASR